MSVLIIGGLLLVVVVVSLVVFLRRGESDIENMRQYTLDPTRESSNIQSSALNDSLKVLTEVNVRLETQILERQTALEKNLEALKTSSAAISAAPVQGPVAKPSQPEQAQTPVSYGGLL